MFSQLSPIDEVSKVTKLDDISRAWSRYKASSQLPPDERTGLLHDFMKKLYHETALFLHTKDTSTHDKELIQHAYKTAYEEYERFHQTLSPGNRSYLILCIACYSNLLNNALAISEEETRLKVMENMGTTLPTGHKPEFKKELYAAGGSVGYALLYYEMKNLMGSFLKNTLSSNTISTLRFIGTISLVISVMVFIASVCLAANKCRPVIKSHGLSGLFSSDRIYPLTKAKLTCLIEERENLLALATSYESKIVQDQRVGNFL
ncbi:MAG: hypothetical protein A2X78_01845 [Gammaproteobacteria bacterium GWE2_37_16]|nr:MAG: hypothetical protein A2X78_01845 [Gammaproteobacteria bacterium GWE2_37_16]